MSLPHKNTKTILLTGIATALLATGPAAAETMTLSKCIDVALHGNPDVASANLEVEATTALSKSARGAFGPRLKLDAGLQRWDKALPLALGPDFTNFFTWIGTSLGTLAANTNTSLPPMPTMASSNVRNQITWSVSATVAQPILSLWTVKEGYSLRELGVDVAEIHRKTVRRDLAFQVTEAYYRVLQAKQLADVAQKSVDNVDAQVKRAQAFYRAGTVGRNDLLRAELGLAAAQQRLIQAKGGVILAKGQLATQMGLAPETDIDPADTSGEPSLAPLAPSKDAENLAVSDRLELKEVARRIEQANAGVRLSWSKMLPQVNAVANITHNEGQPLMGKDAWFIGGTASWDIWEGGGTYYGIDESKARLGQALSAKRKAEDMIRLETRSAHVGVTTAAEALQVARHAVEQAEENFRIEQKRYESADNTSFDVLDAESQLTTARGQHQAAIYDYLIAQSRLARATGRLSPI